MEITAEFWADYQTLVKRLLPPLKAADGFSEAEVTAAEKKLGRPAPPLLREFYLRTGRREDINGIHDRLMTPPEMSQDGEMLVFYEENQGVCSWAIQWDDPNPENPAVLRSDDDAPWEEDFPRLTDFLTAMLFFQCVMGGMRHNGVGVALTSMLISPGPDWEVIEIGGAWNNRVFLRDGQALFVAGGDHNPEVYAGARSKLKFLDIGRRFGVQWSYCTMDDE